MNLGKWGMFCGQKHELCTHAGVGCSSAGTVGNSDILCSSQALGSITLIETVGSCSHFIRSLALITYPESLIELAQMDSRKILQGGIYTFTQETQSSQHT